jgi:hypothetical protein
MYGPLMLDAAATPITAAQQATFPRILTVSSFPDSFDSLDFGASSARSGAPHALQNFSPAAIVFEHFLQTIPNPLKNDLV